LRKVPPKIYIIEAPNAKVFENNSLKIADFKRREKSE